ncbi:MAG: dihydroorotase [Saprospiraceae bacterium]
MSTYVFRNGTCINRGRMEVTDILVRNGRIAKVGPLIEAGRQVQEIDCTGLWIIPGIIDDQVHFREPGLTHKATIGTESRAAVAGGITTFMEMPNTKPPALTQTLLEDKYAIAARVSPANYSFYMGVSNDNYEEVVCTDPKQVCGIKIFMGSSTGNMLVDDMQTLEKVFADAPCLIATHCEDEATIRANLAAYKEQYGDAIPFTAHGLIRSREACLASSSLAVELARKHGTRLHILHITTREEVQLFDEEKPLKDKLITSEVCVHHLHFTDADYPELGSLIKCNPAIKTREDREALREGLRKGNLDIIATDHAPHTWEEKQGNYLEAPSGLPLVQHSLGLVMSMVKEGVITPVMMVEKMAHAPAECFRISERGYLDEGFWADLVVVDPQSTTTVTKDSLHYKCGWSPLEGKSLPGVVKQTWVNGECVYRDGVLLPAKPGQRLMFDRG